MRMPERILSWTVLGCCALAAGAAVLPARWLLLVQPADALVSLADAQGTLWNGSAWIALGPPQARKLLPQPLTWQWRWSSFDVEARHPWLQGPVVITPRMTGVQVNAQSLRAPAMALTALGAPWNTIAPGGMIDVRWQALDTAKGLSGPVAQLRWQDASTALSPLPRIGSYVMRVEGRGGRGLSLALSTEGGLLQLEGQGSTDNKGLRFEGRATYASNADAGQRRSLDQLLNALGPRQGDVVTFGTASRPAAMAAAGG